MEQFEHLRGLISTHPKTRLQICPGYIFGNYPPQMVPMDLKSWFPGFGFDSGPNLQPWKILEFLDPTKSDRILWNVDPDFFSAAHIGPGSLGLPLPYTISGMKGSSILWLCWFRRSGLLCFEEWLNLDFFGICGMFVFWDELSQVF